MNIPDYIKLKPEDWLWATWRPHTPLPYPAAVPFDLTAACNRIKAKARYNYNWQWENIKMPIVQTKEEAIFWFSLMTQVMSTYSSKPEKVLTDFLKTPLPAELSAGDIQDNLKKILFYYADPVLIIPLFNLLSLPQLVEAIAQTLTDDYRHNLVGTLIEGFRTYYLPHLTAEQRAEIRAAVQPYAAGPQDDGKGGQKWHPLLFLGAMIGGMDEQLTHFHESGVATAYSKDLHEPSLALGFSRPELVEKYFPGKTHHYIDVSTYRGWLAHMELAGLEQLAIGAVQAGKDSALAALKTLTLVEHPAVVSYMLKLRQEGIDRAIPREWLANHPEITALGALDCLTSEDKKLVELATKQLQSWYGTPHQQWVEKAIATRPEAEQPALREQLFRQPEGHLPTLDETNTPEWLAQEVAVMLKQKKVKKPVWVDAVELPLLNLSGFAPNPVQLEVLLVHLTKISSPSSSEPPLITNLKKHARPENLEAWAWAIFQQWLDLGADSKEKWALNILGVFGGNQTVLKLVPLIRKWPDQSAHARASLALQCLRRIGTDLALMQINFIAEKIKFKALKKEANRLMHEIAQERNLTADQLADRLVPDCDLDERGQKTFNYGSRQFTFVLTGEMKPMVRDEKGKLLPDLPKPNKQDDAELSAAAVADWKLMKKQIRDVAKIQAVRLEQAMVIGRRWSTAEFETLMVKHPLMVNLARLVVWGGFNLAGELVGTFRITDEQDFANEQDDPINLEQMAQVGPIHPLQLEPAQRQAWGQLLADYDLIQPFAQLGRETYGLLEGEAEQTELNRFGHLKINSAALVGTLEKLGWTRGPAEDGGVFYVHYKRFYAADLTAAVFYNGVPMQMVNDWEDQTIEKCYFVQGRYVHWGDKNKRVALGQVPSLVLSEVLRDLHLIASKGV